MKRAALCMSFVTFAGAISGLLACEGISDPEKNAEVVARVSGALTASAVPSNAHVAIVWRVGNAGRWEVANDVAIIEGRFTMPLAVPANAYFAEVDDLNYDDLSTGASVGSAPEATTTKSVGLFDFAAGLRPRDSVSGHIVTKPLSSARAGFVVYVDKNGNGKLDLEGTNLASADEIVGGNSELTLTYFRDGGTLDYEKLRDRAGVLPRKGFNIVWSGNDGRFMPLDVVELHIKATAKLPDVVCGGAVRNGDAPTTWVTVPTDGGVYYPAPNDPGLTCDADGRSFSWDRGCRTTETPVSGGLCGYDGPIPSTCPPQYAEALDPGASTPEGWPCPIENGHDAGAAP